MVNSLLDPLDPPERQVEKLLKVTRALMRRAERVTDETGAAYEQFRRAAVLEEQVRRRTRELERALDLLNASNAALADASRDAETARANLTNAIETVQEGFALFDSEGILVMCNSRFGLHMPDIHDHLKPGLAFRTYVERVSRSRFIDLPDGVGPRQWADQRMQKHRDAHVIFNVRLVGSRWVQVSEHRTPDGGTVILQTDVTDIMRLERQERDRMLDDQARVIQATLEHLDQGVCIFDAEARLVGWNMRAGVLLSIPVTRFRIGYRFETLYQSFAEQGFVFADGVTPDEIADWVGQREGRRPIGFELWRGDAQALSVRAREMPDGGVVFSITDITAERAAAQAMRRANELLEQRVRERTLELADALGAAERANASKSRFVAAASHDLLQPLSAAKLYMASIDADTPAHRVPEIVEKAGRALDSVEHILEALLDISNLDSGKAAVLPTSIPLQGLLDRLHDEMAPIASAKGLRLRLVATSATVVSDATYLRRILQNLIANAIRYTARGKVLVGARRAGDRVKVQVWDTGPGIPEDKRETIFGEFQRLEAAASAAEGMGLGLAIVDRACGLLDHPLELRSVEGRGTCFSVSLPISRSTGAETTGEGAAAPTDPERIDDLIVLLVENDADLRQALAIALERWNIAVLPAADRAEVRQLIDDEGLVPDAIIADYQLGGDARGIDVIAELQARLGPVPACVISANHGPKLREICQDAGLPLFHKPVAPATLEAFLRGLSARRGTSGS